MDSFPRNLLLLAATAIVAVTLSGPAPAIAADETAVATDVSANGWHKSTHLRRDSPTRVSYQARNVKPAESNLGCSGVWCGRQFVLIVGIGY